MSRGLRIDIVHELPGRLRVRLSHALHDPEGFSTALQTHAGIEPVCYTPHTRSVLVHFEPGTIQREELLVRMALSFSLEHAFRPVCIRRDAPGQGLSAAEALSAGALLVAALGYGLAVPAPLQRRLAYTAGGLTGGAILVHGIREIRAAGVFHPELFSLAYLAAGILRGRVFQAAALTWLAAFGRHVMEVEEPAVRVQPRKAPGGSEVSVSPVPATPAQAFLQLIPAIVRIVQQADKPLDDMLENLRDISDRHNDVLDPLGPWKQGIPIQFQTK